MPVKENAPVRRRGRPRKEPADQAARVRLLRQGLVALTERGYLATGVDEVLSAADVPKGSFYYHFKSKADFGAALIDAYQVYFAEKLERWLTQEALSPLARLQAFIEDAEAGMARHEFRRGCLVGNLGQEMASLPESFRQRLLDVLCDWEARTARCLQQAQDGGEIDSSQDTAQLAAFFWIGWEGAVLRAKLERSPLPLRSFASVFLDLARK